MQCIELYALKYSMYYHTLGLLCGCRKLLFISPSFRQMVKNAVTWAKANKLTRTNEVHGAEEYRIKTFEAFSSKDLTRSNTRASVEVEMEDRNTWHCIVILCGVSLCIWH